MKKTLLAAEIPLPTIGGEGLGPFGKWLEIWGTGEAGAVKALTSLTTIISNIVAIITICAGIWFMFQFITAGLSWLNAGGNKEAISGAQDRMRNALIGLVIVVAAITITGLFGKLLGLDILIPYPGELIKQLKP